MTPELWKIILSIIGISFTVFGGYITTLLAKLIKTKEIKDIMLSALEVARLLVNKAAADPKIDMWDVFYNLIEELQQKVEGLTFEEAKLLILDSITDESIEYLNTKTLSFKGKEKSNKSRAINTDDYTTDNPKGILNIK